MALEGSGVVVYLKGHEGCGIEHNVRYLRTKRDRMGHDLPWLETAPVAPVSTCGNQ